MNILFHCDIARSGAHLWHYALVIAIPFAAAAPLSRIRQRRGAGFDDDEARRARLLSSIGFRSQLRP